MTKTEMAFTDLDGEGSMERVVGYRGIGMAQKKI
jgi:hypothetical protein